VAQQLHQAWDDGSVSSVSRASGISFKSGGSQLVTTAKPHGLVQKLAYKADGFLVSQIAKLQPSDLKEPPELAHDLEAFAASDDYKTYRSNAGGLFPAPGRINLRKRWLAPHRVGFAEWSWQSKHPLIFKDIKHEYRSHRDNQTGLLRTLNLRIKGKPMAILVNGFSSGHHLMERVTWPIREFSRQGIGVSLFALPFHGPRGHAFPPEWPQQDTAFTIEGFRQAIWDLQIAIRAMREAGASEVGVVGMSLGGYTASLLATVTSDVDFVLSYIPIASVPDVMNDNDLVPGSGDMQRHLYEGYREQLVPITPACRMPKVESKRVSIISGEFDRLATVKHGQKLADHFGTELVKFPGGHIVQNRRGQAFRKSLEGFQDAGVLPLPRRNNRAKR
jgi:pimeloyl-ACP methyl ester carboxylesterase